MADEKVFKTKCYCGHTNWCDCVADLSDEQLDTIAAKQFPEPADKLQKEQWIRGAKWVRDQLQ